MSASDVESSKAELTQCQICHKTFPAGSGWLCPDDNGPLVPADGDPLLGTVFDQKYEIQSVLGQGGMSIVYKARHKYMDRTVAVKLLREHLVSDQTARLRFEQESKAASKLTHQNIVSVHDFGITNNGQAYFVMDCLEGDSLADILDNEGRLELSRAINIFKQICDGLEPAHKLGLVHRDLKPSNIIVLQQEDGGDLIKIVDFGIAKFTNKDAGQFSARLTQTGEVFGSPMYMSPEQCQGHQLDPRSDIYSLGCLMYETLTGTAPYFGDSFMSIAMQHMNAPMPPFVESAPDSKVPAAIEEVVSKTMAKDPDQRFQTVGEVRQALLDAALAGGVQGVRAGAVHDPSANSSLKETWEKITGGFAKASSGKAAKEAFSFARLAVIGGPAIAVAAIIGIVVFWHGPSGDGGTPMQKFRWQLEVGLAEQAVQHQNLKQSIVLLTDAREIASTFGDDDSRLQTTLRMLANVYKDAGMYEQQEQCYKDFNNVQAKQSLADTERVKAMLTSLRDQAAKGMINQAEAHASMTMIIDSAKRLHARGYYATEEALLTDAIGTLKRLDMAERPETAELKLVMADCLTAQQKLPQVRPLLVDALETYRRVAVLPDSKVQTNKALIRAYLKLGQFDRDQSSFENSKGELEEALELTQRYFGKDNNLMAESLNSYADLMRQMGAQDDYKQLSTEAKVYNQKAALEPALDPDLESASN
ncbi:MAG TPA: serine/threonine-protein kinase [Candidatus Obscuribacterales bacterium]